MGRFLGTPLIISHSDSASSIFSFTNIPPLTPPAKTLVFELSLGSNIIPLVLPAIFVGPLATHAISGFSPGTPGFSYLDSCSNSS